MNNQELAVVRRIKIACRNFLQDETGLTSVEYVLAGAVASIAAVVTYAEIGTNVSSSIDSVNQF